MLLGKLSFLKVIPEVVALEQIPLEAKSLEESIDLYLRAIVCICLQIIYQRPASISQIGLPWQVVSSWLV